MKKGRGKNGGDYEVGYGKPPMESRFKPGCSGNPAGRPRGAKSKVSLKESIGAIFFAEAARPISVTENGRNTTMTVAQAVLRRVQHGALKGDVRALREFLRVWSMCDGNREGRREQLREHAVDYVHAWRIEARRRAQQGDSRPMPYPKPEDIIFNECGEVWAQGPLSAEQEQTWDVLRRCKTDLEIDIEGIKRELKKGGLSPENERLLRAELKSQMRFLRKIMRGLEGTGPAQ